MVCSKCGAQINDKARFCEECGAQITSGTDSIAVEAPESASGNAESTTNVNPPVSDAKPTHKNGNLGKIIIALISLVAVGIVAVLSYTSESSTYKRLVKSEFNQAVQLINEQNEYISDLSYTISFERIFGDSSGTGTVTFKSEQIENYDPETMYIIMGDISETVASTVSTALGERDFFYNSWSSRYTDWSCNGHKYELSDWGLEKDGVYVWEDAEKVAQSEALDKLILESLEQDKNDSTDSPSYRTVLDSDDEYWYAVSAAQELVKDELKSPSTAKFSYDDSDYTVQRSGDQWKISGYVDAQNGFGATVREYWTATFTMGDISGSQYKVSNYSVTFS